MPDQFKQGQTVRLKSGGPLMTIVEYGDYSGKRKVSCRWFDDKQKLQTAVFLDAELDADDDAISIG